MKKDYRLIVKTNCYTGNFEREMCAFMTGCIGFEDETGEEFVDESIKELFEGVIESHPDDHGTYRPVSVCDDDTNNFEIYFNQKLNSEELEILTKRAEEWEKERPYEYLDKDFKFLGLEQIEIEEVRRTV